MTPDPSTLPWHQDAPDGQCWKCPDCDTWATLGGNAAFHAMKKDHGMPTLQPMPPRRRRGEDEILEAGKRAMAYMHARYGPIPRGDHPETGEPLADRWHEKLGLLIDFQTFDPAAPDFTPEDGKL